MFAKELQCRSPIWLMWRLRSEIEAEQSVIDGWFRLLYCDSRWTRRSGPTLRGRLRLREEGLIAISEAD